MKHIAIIGGGISGLATAHRLIELNPSTQITLLEATPRLGGIIQTETRDGFLLERGPDSFISEKPQALALAIRLGLESELISTNPLYRRSFIVRKGKLLPVPEGFQLLAPSRFWPFIKSDIFSFTGKLRMSADLFLPRRWPNGDNDESLASFVRRRLGQEALERMAQPMVGGIYTADPENLSLRATLPRFLDLEHKHRSLILGMWKNGRAAKNNLGVSGPRYSLFQSFRNGMQTLVDALEEKIRAIDIRLNTKVKTVERFNSGWRVVTENDAAFEADAVCLAVPAYVAARLLSDVSPEVSNQLQSIRFASTATINLAYERGDIRHNLDGFGFVVPFIEQRTVLACTFCNVKFAKRAAADRVLMRAFVGGALQPELLQLSDSEIIDRVEKDLNELLGITGQPLFTQISRWNNSMPQYEVGHLARIDQIDRELEKFPGLVLAGTSYRGAGIPDCVKSGESAAEILCPK